MMRHLLPALALALALAACGGPSDPLAAAQDAISAGRYGEATRLLEGALEGMDRSAREYRDATMLYCEALAEERPAESRTTLLRLVEELPDGVTPVDFRNVVSHLQTHQHYVEAIELMDFGMKRWPADATMTQVKDVLVAQVKAAGDAEGTAALKGLGYL